MLFCFVSGRSRLFSLSKAKMTPFWRSRYSQPPLTPCGVCSTGQATAFKSHHLIKKKKIRDALPLEIGCSKNRSKYLVSPGELGLLSLYPISLNLLKAGRARGLWRNCTAKSRFNNINFSPAPSEWLTKKIWTREAFRVVTSWGEARSWNSYLSSHN